ncbi:MAG TPA: trans-aconitate 2-methyltransferase [Pilimelia sp.]|nr:trans-aconitate 2-methyltransferase [Pilimelia sp.]
MWDPAVYLRYGDERSRPFVDLVSRVGAESPRAVVDLGCGPGTLTETLTNRWPGTRITGLDSSVEMIERATARGGGVSYAVADVRDWAPGSDVDVVVCNAVLQWVPGHERLLTRWAAQLPPGAWLAVQVPGNFDAPSHRALRAAAAEPAYAGRLAAATEARGVPEPQAYARLLTRAGCAADAWETTYVHLLPAGDGDEHPVLRWMEGTALRPVQAVLGDGADWTAFRRDLAARLAEAYPAEDGVVYFPFRRIFAVARTAVARTGAARTGAAGRQEEAP